MTNGFRKIRFNIFLLMDTAMMFMLMLHAVGAIQLLYVDACILLMIPMTVFAGFWEFWIASEENWRNRQ